MTRDVALGTLAVLGSIVSVLALCWIWLEFKLCRACRRRRKLRWIIRGWMARPHCDVWTGQVMHLLPDDHGHDREDDGECSGCQPQRFLIDGQRVWVHQPTQTRSHP
jgi:hypothetical protein